MLNSFCLADAHRLCEDNKILEEIRRYFDEFPIEQSELEELQQNGAGKGNDEVGPTDNLKPIANERSTNGTRQGAGKRVFTNRNYAEDQQYPCGSGWNAGLSVFLKRNLPPMPPEPVPSNEMRRFRKKLPTWNLQADILQTIQQNPVTLITGGTGCGKTTQVPQFLLEHAARNNKPIRIFCTQPRRLPAIAIAKRVARERGETLGDTVGYHIRLEQKVSPNSALIYLTSGVLLRKLTTDELANEATHIILDEIHEREMNTDYLLIVLRQALQKRKDLKLVLMSATMEGNMATFMDYFANQGIGHIDVPSRLFPVECFNLADVLALTDYRPKAALGTFDASSTGFGNTGFGTAAAAPFGTDQQFDNPAAQSQPTTRRACRAVRAVHQHHQQHNSRLGISFNGSGIDFLHHAASTDDIQRLLPNRPNVFELDYLPRFHRGMAKCTKQSAIVNAYLNGGGQQWRDSVDIELVAELVRYLIDSQVPGAILVFLPGFDDIGKAQRQVNALWEQGRVRTEPAIFTLHSQLNTAAQQNVFDQVGRGQRKVVLSTNIAEASLTIDDIVFVIDCGKAKEKGYDYDMRVAQLNCRWIAKSNAEQRKGRAGRCQPGYCFRLYTQEDYNEMLDTQMPEIRRTAIHDVCLNAKMFAPGGINVSAFLQQAPDPPEEGAVRRSIDFLEQLGALYSPSGTDREGVGREPDITELGKTIARLPLEPQLARLLLFGLALKCLDPIITLVAAVSYRDPFLLILDEELKQAAIAARDQFSRSDYSDHLLLIRLMFAFENESTGWCQSHFCKNNFVSEQGMWMIEGIKNQIFYELKRLHLLPATVRHADDPRVNKYSENWPIVQAAIVAGAYPNIGYVNPGTTKINRIRTTIGKNFHIHPSSSLRRQILPAATRSPNDALLEYFVFQEAICTRATENEKDREHAIRTVTAVPQLTIALFAGPIRMDAKSLKHFELVDPDGTLRKAREVLLQEKIAKWREDRLRDKRLWREAQRQWKKGVYSADEEEEGAKVEREEEIEAEKNDLNELLDQLPSALNDEAFLELDQWFLFRGKFDALQAVWRLHFRLMLYFTRFIAQPGREMTKEDKALLACTSDVLCRASKLSKYMPVKDLEKSPLVEASAPDSSRVAHHHYHQKRNYRPTGLVFENERARGNYRETFAYRPSANTFQPSYLN